METSQAGTPAATPNTPEVAAPQTFTNFAELEALASASERFKAPPPEEPKEEPEADTEKAEAKNPEELKDAILAELKGEPKAPAKDPKKSKDAEAKTKEKLFKFTHKDTAADVRPEATVEVKVDGKMEQVKLQDLVDNWSGKTNLSRKYQELADEKRGLQEVVNNLHTEFVTKGDPFRAIEVLAEAIGADPLKVRKELTEGLLKQVDSFASLSPEEREVAKLKEELSWRQRREESERARSETRKVQSELTARIEKVQETHGLTREQLVEAYNEVKDHVPQDQLTPEFLGEYVKFKGTRSGIENLLTESEAEFGSSAERQQAIEKLEKVLKLYPEMSLSELRDYAVEAYGSKQAKNLSRKIKKARPTDTARPEDRRKEPITFDDL